MSAHGPAVHPEQQYQPNGPGQRVAATRPPLTVITAGLAVVGAVAGLVFAIMFFAGGKDGSKAVYEQFMKDSGESTLGAAGTLMNGLGLNNLIINELHSALQARSIVWIVVALGCGLGAVALHGGKNWGRVLVTVFGAIGMVFAVVVGRDLASPGMHVANVIAGVALLAVLILVWLPPNSRYVRARKAAA